MCVCMQKRLPYQPHASKHLKVCSSLSCVHTYVVAKSHCSHTALMFYVVANFRPLPAQQNCHRTSLPYCRPDAEELGVPSPTTPAAASCVCVRVYECVCVFVYVCVYDACLQVCSGCVHMCVYCLILFIADKLSCPECLSAYELV
jgi:hypothetical protein